MLLVRGAVVPPALTGNLVALVSTVLWSSAFPATEYLLRGWDPLLLCAARLAGAALFILALTALAGRMHELRRAPWGDVLLLGAFGVAAPVFLLVAGQDRADAVTVAIVSTTMPLISALMSWLVDGRRPSAMVSVGILLAIAGGSLATTAARGGPDGSARGRASDPGLDGRVDLVLARGAAPSVGSRRLGAERPDFAAGALVAAGVVALALLLGLAQPRPPRRAESRGAAVDEHDRDRALGALVVHQHPPAGDHDRRDPHQSGAVLRHADCPGLRRRRIAASGHGRRPRRRRGTPRPLTAGARACGRRSVDPAVAIRYSQPRLQQPGTP